MTNVTPKRNYFILDFDSTFTKVEGLDELAKIALADKPESADILTQIRSITEQGMNGSLSFQEALQKRLKLLKANRLHIDKLIKFLRDQVSTSVARNKVFFETYSQDILIVSSGFREFIEPIVTEYGIKPENVYANQFTFDAEGNINGCEENNPLAQNNGKVKLMQSLNLQGDIYVIGDGYTDYEIKKAGLANRFYAFTENVSRETVLEKADHVTPSFDEFLYLHKLPMAISYPKSRISVLILENIHPNAQKMFEAEGYNVKIVSSALDEDELCQEIRNVSILCIRSKTEVTRRVLDNASNKLMAIGAFCIGTNQIDLKACMEKGIAVFNAPYSNTRSVVELAIGEMIMLIRNLVDKSEGMKRGIWDKSAKNSFEIRGKNLGIVGYGNIGSQLSVLAESMGLNVYFYDVVDRLALGNAKKCHSLKELLQISDVISLHVDGRKSNANIIGEAEFDLMKNGVVFLNLARGHVVDIAALVKNLKSGKIIGAGVDVFPYEPKNNNEEFMSELREMKNVILTPHIGGSTLEAQIHIADFVPKKIIEYINTGNTYLSVNIPNIQLPLLENAHRLMHIHRNESGVLAQINGILAEYKANIVAQYLKTNESIGYVIMDIDKDYSQEMVEALKNIKGTIRFRILY